MVRFQVMWALVDDLGRFLEAHCTKAAAKEANGFIDPPCKIVKVYVKVSEK